MINLPRDRMDQVVKRFDMLEAQMAAGPAPDAYVKMAAEYADMQELVAKIRELRAAEREQDDLEAMLGDKGTDSEMRALAEADLPEVESRIECCSRKSRYCSCPRTLPTSAMPSWKSVPAPAATRLPCSLAICFGCTSATRLRKAGDSRLFQPAMAKSAGSRKSSLRFPAEASSRI